jgi:hypothetical protein
MGLALAAPVAVAHSATLQPLGTEGRWTGFLITSDSGGQQQPVARVLLQAGEKWTARRLDKRREAGRDVLELRDIDTSGTGSTPELGPGSFVRISAAPGERFPRLDFRFELRSFQREPWQKALGQPAPLCFLALPLTTARLWYVHGLLCPTPQWDPYPLTRSTVRGDWAEGWSYGAALGALTVPAMALWDDRSRQMVGYEWAEARLTDKSDKDVGIAYCAGIPGWPEQFLTLLSNAQKQWTTLTDPVLPTVVESRLRVIYSEDVPPTADVNQLVLQHLYADDRPLLPAAPAMNDLSWMASRGLDDLGNCGPSGGGFLGEIRKGDWGFNEFFYDPGTVLYGGGYRGIDQMYKQHKTEAIARFDKDLTEYLKYAQWRDIDGDRCCVWRFPLKGSWNERMGGEAADTVHHVAPFGVGASMLAAYVNTGREDLLPYIDGLFNWVRHYVYTRGDISDIPESMFTLQSGTLAMDFLMNYRQAFANAPDAEHRKRAQEAFDLAYMVVYRNANVTIGDSDERDNISPAFMMPGNMAKFWLGQISNAELSEPFRAMIVMHVETGDPVFKWLVRGALDRWWIGYKEDCWHTAENIDIWGVSTGEKNLQTGIHDPCDTFWEWSQPVGDAFMRVTCGAKAAMAFCRGTRALDVDRYSFKAPAGFRFRITRLSAETVPEPFSIIVSSPFRDLGGLPVRINGKSVPQADLRVLGTYREHLSIRGVRAGDTVEVGDVGDAPVIALPNVPSATRPSQVPAEALRLDGRSFSLTDLTAQADVRLADDWNSPDHWGGLPAGLQYATGVPYVVQPAAVGPGRSLALKGSEAYIFGVAPTPGAISVTTAKGETKLGPDDGLLATKGWPFCRWKLLLYPVRLEGGSGTIKVEDGGLVLGVTTLRDGPGIAEKLLLAAGPAKPAVEPWAGVLAEARARLAAAGGAARAPVAFIPPCGTTYPALSEWAQRLGLNAVTLTPEELATPGVLAPAKFPVAVYTGDEEYLQTVRAPLDAEKALLQYVRDGGTLIVAGICRPFTYGRDLTAPDTDQPAKPTPWALLGKQFELFLLGPGEKTGDAIGFERPPADEALTLKLGEKQPVLWDYPAEMPFPTDGDLRFRPLTREGVDPADEVLPIISATTPDGRAYGSAAALIRHHCAAFKDAQVLFAWGTLLNPPFAQRDKIAAEILTYAVTSSPAAREPLPPNLSLAAPPDKPQVAVLPPDCGGREEIIRQACASVGKPAAFLSPAQFVAPQYFDAKHFPVAIQAVAGESFITSFARPGDGDDAYKRLLRKGGTLIVCQSATPFAYELVWEKGKWKSREPQRFWSMAYELGFEVAYGFEKPDEPMWLELTDEGRKLWPDLPQRFELKGLSDPRWRYLIPYRSSAARDFIPLARATKPDGTPYPGLAAAMVRFRDSDYAGAKLIYLWGGMVEGDVGEKLLTGCLK